MRCYVFWFCCSKSCHGYRMITYIIAEWFMMHSSSTGPVNRTPTDFALLIMACRGSSNINKWNTYRIAPQNFLYFQVESTYGLVKFYQPTTNHQKYKKNRVLQILFRLGFLLVFGIVGSSAVVRVKAILANKASPGDFSHEIRDRSYGSFCSFVIVILYGTFFDCRSFVRFLGARQTTLFNVSLKEINPNIINFNCWDCQVGRNLVYLDVKVGKEAEEHERMEAEHVGENSGERTIVKQELDSVDKDDGELEHLDKGEVLLPPQVLLVLGS